MIKGFSTHNIQFSNKFTLSGLELAKQDLMNHFNIRKGEKLMSPEFRCIIWDSLYDPLTDAIVEDIESNIQEIVAYDPRIEAESILVEQYENGLLIEMNLTYIPDQQVDRILLDFSQTNSTATLSTA